MAPEVTARPARSPGTANGWLLALAGAASMIASTCCVVPLLLALAGVTGAWIGALRAVEPGSLPLTIVASMSLGIAAWRLFGPPSRAGMACGDSSDRRCSKTILVARRWFWMAVLLTLVPIVVPLVAPLFY